MGSEGNIFSLIGGRSTLERVHEVFYDKLYEHPWLKHFFRGIDQKHIEDQQTDFMSSRLGGPVIYAGQFPSNAHRQMYITQEMFDIRRNLLRESLSECGVPDNLAQRWLDVDQSFAKDVVKSDLSECKKRFFTDEIINVPKPSSCR